MYIILIEFYSVELENSIVERNNLDRNDLDCFWGAREQSPGQDFARKTESEWSRNHHNYNHHRRRHTKRKKSHWRYSAPTNASILRCNYKKWREL